MVRGPQPGPAREHPWPERVAVRLPIRPVGTQFPPRAACALMLQAIPVSENRKPAIGLRLAAAMFRTRDSLRLSAGIAVAASVSVSKEEPWPLLRHSPKRPSADWPAAYMSLSDCTWCRGRCAFPYEQQAGGAL